jgi:hypothetical protein
MDAIGRNAVHNKSIYQFILILVGSTLACSITKIRQERDD